MANGIEKLMKEHVNEWIEVSYYYENHVENLAGILKEVNDDIILIETSDEKMMRAINRKTCLLLMISWKIPVEG